MACVSGATAELPLLYAEWIGPLLGGPIPAETNATCQSCAMVAPPGEPAGASGFFDPHLKCCTYWPDLPNFLVGRMLVDQDAALAAGQERVAALLGSIGCTPRGLHPPAARRVVYREAAGDAFGRARSLVCPYFIEEGLCGIWRYREAVCATWFCKHVRGAVGMRFWNALKVLLAAVEQQLAGWCILELDPGEEVLRRCFSPGDQPQTGRLDADQLDGVADPGARRALWGRWHGREREYFAECARRVSALTWEQVLANCGPEVRAFAQLARQAYAELLSDALPARLQAAPIQLIQLDSQRCRTVTYSDLDPLDLPRRLLAALGHFDGRPVEAALQAAEDEEGLRLHPRLLRKLVDFRILVSAEDLNGTESSIGPAARQNGRAHR